MLADPDARAAFMPIPALGRDAAAAASAEPADLAIDDSHNLGERGGS